MKSISLQKASTIFGIFGLLLFSNLILSSCKKETIKEITIYNGALDKKITLIILDDHYGVGSGYDTTVYSSSIINFNKNDYQIIDSIFFMISDLKTSSTFDGSDIVKTITIELFDLTNNVGIGNSKLITDDVNAAEFKSSGNLINYLPETPINLGIRIINDDRSNCSWQLHAASLVLVRK